MNYTMRQELSRRNEVLIRLLHAHAKVRELTMAEEIVLRFLRKQRVLLNEF